MVLAGTDPAGGDRVHPRVGTPAQADQNAVRPARQEHVPALAAHLHHHPLLGEQRVRAGQRGGVDREHRRLTRPGRPDLPGQQPPQPDGVDAAAGQRVVHRPVPATKLRLQGQLHRRPHRPLRTQHRIRQLEQRITAAQETTPQAIPEPTQRAQTLDRDPVIVHAVLTTFG